MATERKIINVHGSAASDKTSRASASSKKTAAKTSTASKSSTIKKSSTTAKKASGSSGVTQLLAQNFMSTDSVKAIGKASGLNAEDTSELLSAALPVLVQSMSNNASTKSGAESLSKALSDHAGTDTADLSSFLANSDKKDGEKIVQHILGSNTDTVTEALSKDTGVSRSKVSSLLAVAAPLLLSLLGSQSQSSGITSGGLGSLLSLLGGSSGSSNSSSGLGSLLSAMGTLNGSNSYSNSGSLLGSLLGSATTAQTGSNSSGDLLSSLLGGSSSSSSNSAGNLLGSLLGGSSSSASNSAGNLLGSLLGGSSGSQSSHSSGSSSGGSAVANVLLNLITGK